MRGGIQAALHGFDAARFLKSMLAALLLGNGNIYNKTRIMGDNSIVVEHVHSINSATKERRSNGFLESNREGVGNKSAVSLIAYNGEAKHCG